MAMRRVARRYAADSSYPIAALAAGLAGWWLFATLADVPPFVLPSPGAVAARLVGNPALYGYNALFTLEKVVYGGTVGILAGTALGVLLAYVPGFRRAVYPYLVTVRVLPKIAIAPVLLIYLGTGMATAVVFIAAITFFPLVLNTAAGLAQAPPEHHDLLRSVDAGLLRRTVHVDLPHALPDVFAGLKQAVTLSVIGAVVAEWVVADNGLGYLVLLGSENVRADVILAAVAVLIAMGLTLYGLVVLVQRATRRWTGMG